MSQMERLKEKLAKLRLKGMLENLDSVVKQTAEKNLDPWTALSMLADLEIEQRLQNSVALRWRQSKLNEKVSIDQFDFDHHKSRNVAKRENSQPYEPGVLFRNAWTLSSSAHRVLERPSLPRQ